MKRGIVSKVNEGIAFLKSVNEANGNLDNMTWKHETDEKIIIDKAEQKLWGEKKKWKKDNGAGAAPPLTPQELCILLSSIHNNADLGCAHAPDAQQQQEEEQQQQDDPTSPLPPMLELQRGGSDAIMDGLYQQEGGNEQVGANDPENAQGVAPMNLVMMTLLQEQLVLLKDGMGQ